MIHRPPTSSPLAAGRARGMHRVSRAVLAFGLTLAGGFSSHVHAVARVPAGFESLLTGQHEQVELRFLDRSIGLVPALVKPDTIQFERPARLLEMLLEKIDVAHGLQPSEKSALLRELGREIERNDGMVCPAGADSAGSGCGYMDTDGVAVIYDERQGQANLFIATRWADSFAPAERQYHSEPSAARNGLIHSQLMNLSADSYSQNVSLSGVGALGLTRRGYVGFDWSYFNNRYRHGGRQRLNLGNLYARQDLDNAHYIQAGRMDQRDLSGPRGGSFDFLMLPLPQMDGTRLGTTQAYVNRQAASQGTPVTVMLTQAARVDVYRGERLLGTQYLPAGVQRIDTSSFDAGSYPLTLRVFENSVLTRTQEVPFSKSGMGIGDSPQWFLQAGRLSPRNGNDARYRPAMSKPTAQLGGRAPLTHNLAGIAGLSAVDGNSFAETGLRWQRDALGGDFSVSATYLQGAHGARGNAQYLTYTNGASFSLYRNQMRGSSCQPGARGLDSLGCYDSLNFSASTKLARWSLAAGYAYSRIRGSRAEPPAWDSESGFEKKGDDPRPVPARHRTASMARQTAQLTASRSFSLLGRHTNLRVGLFHARGVSRESGAYAGLSFSFNAPSVAGSASSNTSATVSMRSSQAGPARLDYGASRSWSWQDHGYQEVGVAIDGYRNESFTGSVRGRTQGRHGNLEASLHDGFDRRSGRHRPGISGSYSSALAVADGSAYLGGTSSYSEPASAVAVHLDSAEAQAESGVAAQIHAGAAGSLALAPGQSLLLPAAGYDLTRVDIRDAGQARGDAVGVAAVKGGGAIEPFLPPGKVLVKKVGVTVSFTYAGRLLDEAGAPLANARLLNAPAAPSSEEGGVVFDLDHRIATLFIHHQNKFLQCPMAVKGPARAVLLVGEVNCSPIAFAALPAEIRHIGAGASDAPGAEDNGRARPEFLDGSA